MSKKPFKFAHLHQHTAYSLLDGAARIKDLMAWVKEVTPENPALAMTDHGNMHGAVEFYKAAYAEGVKPIIGFEAYVAAGSRFEKKRSNNKLDGGYFHLTLLAKDFTGYKNLCKLNSRGWTEGFYSKPRVDHELLQEHSEGVIAMSGCLGAQIPRSLLDLGEDAGEAMLQRYLDIYKEDFFIELQNHVPANTKDMDEKLRDLVEQQTRLNPMLKRLADKYGLGMVATNDGHYVKKEDAKAHEALLAIQTKTTLTDPNRFRFPCEEFYVKTPAEMAKALPEQDFPSALENSMLVADMCNVTLPIGSKRVYQMPELPIPEGRTLAEQLRIQTYEGLIPRYEEINEDFFRAYLGQTGAAVPDKLEEVFLALAKKAETGRKPKEEGQNFDSYDYPHLTSFKETWDTPKALSILERAEFELGVIIAMGFPDYFLIVADFINWAKDNGIAVGPGRGSGAGSIVAYAIRVTNIDPLEYDLLFERFLNPDRVSMPDFDIDFSDVRRGEVIDYVREKYGNEKVAHIATFGTMASKAAIKDAARVLEAPYADADAISKLIPVVFGRSTPIAKAMEEVPEIKQAYDGGAKEFVDVAMALEGLTRHASVHAAGVIIAKEPVQELAPVFKSGDGPLICQYDMGSIEDLGFIKMDFLGLRTLSFIEAAVRIIKETRNEVLDPDAFPLNDPKTMDLLSQGEAAGIFQFEGAGMVDTLRKLKPRRIQDLIAVSALYRPGPMENIPTYIRRHHGKEDVVYKEFPKSEKYLAPILEETYGIPVYQEQIMQIAQAVAGYSLGEADLLRRAMGKKKVAEMEKHRKIFEQGASEKDIPAKEANAIFDLLEKFANYGFNKCLVADTLITNAETGELHRIEDLFRRQDTPKVISMQDTFSLGQDRSVAVMENGLKPVYKLTSSLGKTLIATGNHPLRTLNGWKNLEDLSIGDRIASPAKLDIQTNVRWEKHKLILLGWIIAEGNTCHPCGAYLYSKDKRAVDDMVQAALCFPNTQPTCTLRQERQDTFDVYLGTGKRGSASQGRSGARLWLESLGMVGQKATNKHFPKDVFTLKPCDLAVLLGRYWSGDGFIAGQGNLTPYAATSSSLLAKQLQHLLLRFGIVSRLSEKTFKYKTGRIGYTVHLLGRRSIEAFNKHISPHLIGKDKQLRCLKDSLAHTPSNRESIDMLPAEIKTWVQEEKNKHGLTWREVEDQSGVCVKEFYGSLKAYKKGVRRASILKLANFFQSKTLKQVCSEDIFWESVVSIEPAGEAMTYDLEVARNHNFVANDLIVHNSHSAAYGALSYQTAYLKAHYPVEFAAALLTVERANSDKVAQYAADAKHLGIDVLPPNINESRSDFTPVDGVVRFGLYGIKNVGDAAVEHILQERQTGVFKDLWDFCKRIDSSSVNKRALEHLIKSGAFDDLGERHVLLANHEVAMKWGAAERSQAAMGQFGLFGVEDVKPPALDNAPELTDLELLRMEKDALGLYISSHPMQSYPGLAASASCPVEHLESWFRQKQQEDGFTGRTKIALAGILQNVVKKPTRKGTMMARFDIADETGYREVVAFSRTYEQIADLLSNDAPVVLIAELSEDGESIRIVADRLIRWDQKDSLPEVAILEFELSSLNNEQLMELRSLIDEYTGITPVQLRFNSPQGWVMYETEGIRINKAQLDTLKQSCPWLTTSLSIDTRKLLKPSSNSKRYYRQPKTPPVSDVPF